MSEIMQGFPPKEEYTASLANWRRAPFCHWAFHHVREIIPTAEIKNDSKNIWNLTVKKSICQVLVLLIPFVKQIAMR